MGFCLWLGALHFVQEQNAPSPFEHVHFFYVPAGLSHMMAGLAMIWANRALRAYFQDPRSQRMKRPLPWDLQQLQRQDPCGQPSTVGSTAGAVPGQEPQVTAPNGVALTVMIPDGVPAGGAFQVAMLDVSLALGSRPPAGVNSG